MQVHEDNAEEIHEELSSEVERLRQSEQQRAGNSADQAKEALDFKENSARVEANLVGELAAKQRQLDETRAQETMIHSSLIAECHAHESHTRLKAIDEVEAERLQGIRDRSEIQLLRE